MHTKLQSPTTTAFFFFDRKTSRNTLTNINLLFIITVVKAVSQFPFFNLLSAKEVVNLSLHYYCYCFFSSMYSYHAVIME